MSIRTSRRLFLTGVGAAGLVSACGTSSNAPGARSATPGSAGSIAIAHRGGGGDWPEMTLYAYQQAITVKGLTGMEVSVHLSRDGVLVCNHAADTAQLGSKALVIANSTWTELSTVLVSARATAQPDQPARPLTRLDDLLDWWPRTMPLWIEPKVDAAVGPLQKALHSLATPPPIVWKQPVNFSNFAFAKRHGWRTWGYVLKGAEQVGYARTFAKDPTIDMLGAWNSATDDDVRQVVAAATAAGKSTVMWQINNQSDRERAFDLGCRGLMISRVKELLS